jgi:cation:H+ antiporter
LLWVLGVSALIGALVVKKHEERGLLIAIAAALVLPFALFFTGFGSILGLALLALFIVYAVFIFKEKTVCDLESSASVTRGEAVKAIAFFIIGTAFMLGGAKVALDNAVILAQEFGLSSVVIGATLISLGTTIPELSVNIAAMRKRKPSIAWGNAIGSCAVNLTLVLGTGLFLAPVALDASRYYLQLFAEVFAALIVGYFVFKRVRLKRVHGIALLALWIAFLAASVYFGRI